MPGALTMGPPYGGAECMWARTRITERLRIDHPIIQGPLGGGLSPPTLVAAVSDGGGLGSCGANASPPDEIGRVATEIRSRTARPFALNLWVGADTGAAPARGALDRAIERLAPLYRELGIEPPTPPPQFAQDFSAQAAAVLAARPAAFSFVFGIPSPDILRECRERDIFTLGTATSVAEARALEAACVDAVVATGLEAGGMRPTFLGPDDGPAIATLALVPRVVDAVGIPVVAAGGIADARGVAAALALGADAVQLGTAFLACAESGAPDIHRRALRGDAAGATVMTRAFNGRTARVIANRFAALMERDGGEVLPFPIQAWLAGTLRKAAIEQGRGDLLAMQAGQSAALLRHHHAGALMEDLVRGTDAIFTRLAPQDTDFTDQPAT